MVLSVIGALLHLRISPRRLRSIRSASLRCHLLVLLGTAGLAAGCTNGYGQPLQASDTKCRQFLLSHGVMFGERGPTTAATPPPLYESLQQAVRMVTQQLGTECPDSSAAQVHRANLFLMVDDRKAAMAALEVALRLNRDWSLADATAARTALNALRPLVESRPPTSVEEQATHALSSSGTMWLPDDISRPTVDITYNVPLPTSRTGESWIPWAFIGGIAGAVAGSVLCTALGCFEVGDATSGNRTFQPVPRSPPPMSSTVPGWRPPISIVDTGNKGEKFIEVKSFPALRLPPPDPGQRILQVFDQEVESCKQFGALLDRFEVTEVPDSLRGKDTGGFTVGEFNATPKAPKQYRNAAKEICLEWQGWESWIWNVYSKLVPLRLKGLAGKALPCRTAVEEFNDAVRRHEAQHQRDYTNVVQGPNLAFSICGMDALQVSDAYGKRVVTERKAALDALGEKLHKRPEGVPISVGWVCEVCGAGPIRSAVPAAPTRAPVESGIEHIAK